LRNQSIRMVKKKFYTIFNKMENMESYFSHLDTLFIKNVQEITLEEEDLNEKKNEFVSEDEIVELSKRYLTI